MRTGEGEADAGRVDRDEEEHQEGGEDGKAEARNKLINSKGVEGVGEDGEGEADAGQGDIDEEEIQGGGEEGKA